SPNCSIYLPLPGDSEVVEVVRQYGRGLRRHRLRLRRRPELSRRDARLRCACGAGAGPEWRLESAGRVASGCGRRWMALSCIRPGWRRQCPVAVGSSEICGAGSGDCENATDYSIPIAHRRPISLPPPSGRMKRTRG
ncbi:unnamed protein product, partial [Urochloa humidicola]